MLSPLLPTHSSSNISVSLHPSFYLSPLLSIYYLSLLSIYLSSSIYLPSTYLLSFKLPIHKSTMHLAISHTPNVSRSVHTNYQFLFIIPSTNPKAALEYARLTRSLQKDSFPRIPSELFTFLKLCKSCPGGMLNPAKCKRL